MYIKVTSIIHSSKLHQKSTSKRRGSLSILTCRRNFDIDLTCSVCWYNRIKLSSVSSQNHRSFNVKFLRCFNVDNTVIDVEIQLSLQR